MSKKKSGKFCVAAGCTSTHRDNVSLHEFPKETRPEIRRKWISFVKMKRKDFTTPTQFSVLCEKHFAPNCYPLEYSIKKSMGIEVKKKNLLPEAIPTVQTVDSDKRAEASSLSRHESPERPSQPKKMRPAFRKRECMRVIQTATSATEVSDVQMEDEGSIQLSNTESTTRSVGLQFGGKSVHKRSKRCQTKLKTMDKAIQANVQKRQHTTSIGIQCNRNLEDIEDLKKLRKRNEWERMRSEECSETTPHAANFTSKCVDPDYEPSLSDDSQSDISSTTER
ncbi:THAP domain-containing protein 10-like [Saccostrea echinata]|uniref:THAP domain-containing protein 10-like n=1 Tax=Saccostrea echinata TaxID=191078 RepID=UPI002A813533|nr:THAP domain-containing protein 10-like [Saccostrea echinata]